MSFYSCMDPFYCPIIKNGRFSIGKAFTEWTTVNVNFFLAQQLTLPGLTRTHFTVRAEHANSSEESPRATVLTTESPCSPFRLSDLNEQKHRNDSAKVPQSLPNLRYVNIWFCDPLKSFCQLIQQQMSKSTGAKVPLCDRPFLNEALGSLRSSGRRGSAGCTARFHPLECFLRRQPGYSCSLAQKALFPLISPQTGYQYNSRTRIREKPRGRSCTLCCGALVV